MEIESVRIRDDFWDGRLRRIAEEILPHQYRVLNDEVPGLKPSHSIENFRIAAGLSDSAYQGMLFQDSDIYKWIEAAAWSLRAYPSPWIEEKIDGLAELFQAAMAPDGYLHTYHICNKLERFSNVAHGHELYCAGHLIEAACAYCLAAGKDNLLEVARRFADYLAREIGPEEGKRHIYSGHPEIELALFKLYALTGVPRYRALSEYFLNARGQKPCFLEKDGGYQKLYTGHWYGLDYHQAHRPVREQFTAEGHAVRAVYLYTAMADMAALENDEGLKRALDALWHSVTARRMYVTGGIGSEAHGERFSVDFDLPNDRGYLETCASVGMMFWAQRMFGLEKCAEYCDVLERELYNGVLPGLSLDAKRYFYVNPLSVKPELAAFRYDLAHVEPERVGWFGCACCPPNAARLLMSLDRYVYSCEEDNLYVQMYIGGTGNFRVDGRPVSIEMSGGGPLSERVQLRVRCPEPLAFSLHLRVPDWAEAFHVSLNGERVPQAAEDGFVELRRTWGDGDAVALEIQAKPGFLFAHPLVAEDIGKCCLSYGPFVYCFEEADNGPNLHLIRLKRDEAPEIGAPAIAGETLPSLTGGCLKTELPADGAPLYGRAFPSEAECAYTAVPYYAWGNRGMGEMSVWMRV